jgi:hypothetical protein
MNNLKKFDKKKKCSFYEKVMQEKVRWKNGRLRKRDFLTEALEAEKVLPVEEMREDLQYRLWLECKKSPKIFCQKTEVSPAQFSRVWKQKFLDMDNKIAQNFFSALDYSKASQDVQTLIAENAISAAYLANKMLKKAVEIVDKAENSLDGEYGIHEVAMILKIIQPYVPNINQFPSTNKRITATDLAQSLLGSSVADDASHHEIQQGIQEAASLQLSDSFLHDT